VRRGDHAEVEPYAAEQQSRFKRQGDRGQIPQPQPDLHRVVVQREVGAMDHEVQDPVRRDRKTNHQCRHRPAATPGEPSVSQQRSGRPEERREQVVGIRHVVEIERIRGRNAGDDPNLLDAEQDKRRPEDVEQLDGDKQNP
jgi:hypothetical protein